MAIAILPCLNASVVVESTTTPRPVVSVSDLLNLIDELDSAPYYSDEGLMRLENEWIVQWNAIETSLASGVTNTNLYELQVLMTESISYRGHLASQVIKQADQLELDGAGIAEHIDLYRGDVQKVCSDSKALIDRFVEPTRGSRWWALLERNVHELNRAWHMLCDDIERTVAFTLGSEPHI